MPMCKFGRRRSSVTPFTTEFADTLPRRSSLDLPDGESVPAPVPFDFSPVITMEDLELAARENSRNNSRRATATNGHPPQRKSQNAPSYGNNVEMEGGDPEALFLSDGTSRIDFILVYQSGSRTIDRRRAERRATLEAFMTKEGLSFEIDMKPLPGHLLPGLDTLHNKLHEIPGMNRLHPHETEEPHGVESPCLCFMKIHATFPMLTKYADIMKLKMPLIKGNENLQDDELLRYFPNPFRVNRKLLPPLKEEFTSFFSQARIDQFHITDQDKFFSPAQRSQIVWECLSRIKYHETNPTKFGIQRLLGNDTYTAAFPLHDGPITRVSADQQKPSNLRSILHDQWGRFGKWFKIQPIDYVKLYFGERIAFYFAFLEFYTAMLIPAALVGLGCFIYGAASLYQDIPTSEICFDRDVGNITMCPLCDKWCPFWRVKDSCALSRATYLFDNSATVFFSTFMAFWAMLFFELWQRRQSVVAWNFDTLDALEQYEPVRPELARRVMDQRINTVTNTLEPYVPRWKKWMHGLLSLSVVSFMMFVVLAAVFGTVVYRMLVVVALYATSTTRQSFASQYATYITAITSAFLNLIVILILEKIYYRVAKWLTNMECPRSQTEYEKSLTWKYYIFEFVNCYSSLVYVAFFKGRIPPGYPGVKGWFNIPIDQCDQAGCIIELCIQLAVILLGKQIYSIIREAVFPLLSNWWSSQDLIKFFTHVRHFYRWEKDLQLRPFPPLSMFKEYSRMVLQFGFITTFGAAFPLAPLFALLCNLFEIRFDAYKILVIYRRPISQIAKNIGAWFEILQHLAQFAVVSNAFVIAFTSEFVPKMVYLLAFSPTRTMKGYTAWSLSAYKVSDFPEDIKPSNFGEGFNSTTICYYRGTRNGPEYSDELKYTYSMIFWHILAARLAMVLVVEHFILITTRIIAYMIPDLPSYLQARVLRQNFLAKEAFYESESKRISLVETQSDGTQITPSATAASLYPSIPSTSAAVSVAADPESM
ncbi:Anoctamin-4 [Hypsibius exemplaris]|uniref:Anoctamin n=1 Tax=Hypsibius exemplaris TaxID=2072580 RepID=A0A1W0WQ36_HYPEX|nr:Anoctamin-4 [Hypsibius exemplaris]